MQIHRETHTHTANIGDTHAYTHVTRVRSSVHANTGASLLARRSDTHAAHIRNNFPQLSDPNLSDTIMRFSGSAGAA